MVAKTIRELKQGEWFTLKPLEYPKESQVYIRSEQFKHFRWFVESLTGKKVGVKEWKVYLKEAEK